MNEKFKLPHLLAGAFAAIAFVGSFSAAVLMLINGKDLLWNAKGFSHHLRYMELHPDAPSESHEALFTTISAVAAFCVAVSVFRIARSQSSHGFTFHACFCSGLAILGYCLWSLLYLFHLFERAPEFALLATFTSGLFVCCFGIPVSLLLLSCATLYDNSRNA